MSDLLYNVLSSLSERSSVARHRAIEAKGIYARFMLKSQSDDDSAGMVIAAADELGIGTDGIIRDLVNMAFAKAVPMQIQENDNAIAEARAAILDAKRELTTARGRMSPDAIARANVNLRARVSDAVALEEWGESLQEVLGFVEERGETFKADIDAAAAAKREADQRKKQFAAATTQSPRAPADAPIPITTVPTTAEGPGDGTVTVTSVPDIQSVTPDGATTPPETELDGPKLAESIIPDLTPKPVAE